MKNPLLRIGKLLFVSLVLSLLVSCKQQAVPPKLIWSVDKQDITGQPQLVYQLKQRAGVPMLIKAWGYEVEFELTTNNPDTQATHSTRTPYIRLGPHFQMLEKREEDTEIQVTINAINLTKNAHVSVEAYELSEADQGSRRQIEAYRLVSDALESTQSENRELWLEKVGKLQGASKILRNLGQDETRMWIESYVNYFTYFPLYQYDEAVRKSKDLEIEAHKKGLDKIEMLALQIQGQALIERNSTDSEEAARKKNQEAQSIFDGALKLAIQQGFEYEQAWITNNKGVGYLYAGEQNKALKEIYRAELLATNISENFLLAIVQANIVGAYKEFGEIDGAIEALSRIVESDPVKKSNSQSALIRVEIAMLHDMLYEFPQAISGLSSALKLFEILEDEESQGRTILSLASAYFEIGNITRSMKLLSLALPMFESSNFGRGLYGLHRIQGNIFRQLSRFKEMSHQREEQMKYVSTDYEQASIAFEIAKDFFVQKRFAESKKRFIKSQNLALETNQESLKVISKLYLCLIQYETEIYDDNCLSESKQLSLTSVKSIKNVRLQFEGAFLWAQINLRAGKKNIAFGVLDELVNNIRFFRAIIPGVLGSWFWENNKKIFEVYLKVSADRHSKLSVSAYESLKSIERLKTPVSQHQIDTQSNVSDFDTAKAMRNLIANLDSGKSKLSTEDLMKHLDELILSTSNYSPQVIEEVGDRWLNDSLAIMPENSALLTIYPFGGETYVWIANKKEIILEKLSQDFDINSALEKVLRNIRFQGNTSIQPELQKLGQLLLKPVIANLPEIIYFLPLGKFNGFPIEALIVDDHYFIENHQVINISSLDSLRLLTDSGDLTAATNRIFFAGNQSLNDTLMVDLLGVSEEQTDIKKIFNESTIHFHTGAMLTTDSFYSSEIIEADIIHIASHVELDITYPELSRIYLNSNFGNHLTASNSMLIPSDIRAGKYNADLVVLSACQTSGLNKFAFDSNLGFVSEFLASGTSAVIASLWPISDNDASIFVRDFYSNLKQDSNIANSLTKVKRAYIRRFPSHRVEVWAAFQIYI